MHSPAWILRASRTRGTPCLLLTFAVLSAPGGRQASSEEERFRAEREAMVREQIESRGIDDPEVLRALHAVPRHLFVAPAYRNDAYGDYPLPIGSSQTISQPYIVALMTQVAYLEPGDVVLEVGTGSGYQAAVLAEIVRTVYTIEILPSLGEQARARFAELGYTNVEVRIGDGYQGWPEHAPFDAILVTAAAEEVPSPLIEQLKPGGTLVIPVGQRDRVQTLMQVVKAEDGTTISRNLIPVRFVPLARQP